MLLHIIIRKDEIGEERVDVCPTEEYLQVSYFELPEGKTFKPHKHIFCERHTVITQESWIVIAGKIKAIHYDIDDTILEENILDSGDCTITFEGGHNYLSLENGTKIYELKNGPYFGQEADKTFIGEK